MCGTKNFVFQLDRLNKSRFILSLVYVFVFFIIVVFLNFLYYFHQTLVKIKLIPDCVYRMIYEL